MNNEDRYLYKLTLLDKLKEHSKELSIEELHAFKDYLYQAIREYKPKKVMNNDEKTNRTP